MSLENLFLVPIAGYGFRTSGTLDSFQFDARIEDRKWFLYVQHIS